MTTSYSGFEVLTIQYIPEWGGDAQEAPAVGEAVAPGLVITPAVGESGTFQGNFTVTHSLSGNAIVRASACISCARAAARVAMRYDVDWTRDGESVAADPLARQVALEMRAILVNCGAVWSCA